MDVRPDLLEAKQEDFSGLSYQPYLLYDDPVFPEILMLERPLALVTYLLGESCHLSSIGSHFKGPGGEPLRLHSDNGNGMPSPISRVFTSCQCELRLNALFEGGGRTGDCPW